MTIAAPGGPDGGFQFLPPKEEEDVKMSSPDKKCTVAAMQKFIGLQGPPVHSLDNTEVASTSTVDSKKLKVEKPEEDFAFDEPPLKKLKSATCPQGNPVKYAASAGVDEDYKMNWDIVQVPALFPFITKLASKCKENGCAEAPIWFLLYIIAVLDEFQNLNWNFYFF